MIKLILLIFYNFFISEWIKYGEVVPFFQVIKKYDLIGCCQCLLKLKSNRYVSLSLNVFQITSFCSKNKIFFVYHI